ncbi:MAG: NifB/NifX family molybdenum-iron cluster-binding protein [Deltaproteobacteria bacterium]|nr:NifB/NifX family molybdenum-iron cluster-binding protein [Deltaproteobacteria bacterium]
MKIAVSSNGNNLDSLIDPRFGRCAYFLLVDTGDMNFKAFDNESIALGGGAGIRAAQFVASKGAEIILTGHVGPNAVKALKAAGIEVFVEQVGTVRKAIERYKSGTLESTHTANVSDHYGMDDGSSAEKTGSVKSSGDRDDDTTSGLGGDGISGSRGRGMGGGRCGGMGGGRGRRMDSGRNRV